MCTVTLYRSPRVSEWLLSLMSDNRHKVTDVVFSLNVSTLSNADHFVLYLAGRCTTPFISLTVTT